MRKQPPKTASRTATHLKKPALLSLFLLIALGMPKTTQGQGLPWIGEVHYYGLVAFVADKSGNNQFGWALLPDAEYNSADPDTIKPGELPPCLVDDELKAIPNKPDRKAFLDTQYLPHKAWIRFKDANIDVTPMGGAPTTDFLKGFSLAETEVIVTMGTMASITNIDLRHAVSVDEVQNLTGKSPKDYQKLRSGVLATKFPKDDALSAIVKMIGGERLKASPLACMIRGVPTTILYSFTRPRVFTEPACSASGTELAERTILSRKFPAAQSMEIKFTKDTAGTPKTFTLKVTEKTPGKPVLVEVLNVPQMVIDNPNIPLCDFEDHTHYRSFRWYYSLAKLSDANKCPDHVSPCFALGNFGDTRCPQMELIK